MPIKHIHSVHFSSQLLKINSLANITSCTLEGINRADVSVYDQLLFKQIAKQ